MNVPMHIERVSMRGLAEAMLRSGDLVPGSFEAMRIGAMAHRAVQAKGGVGYTAEVTVRASHERDGVLLEISGRIDGLIEGEHCVTIEEYKTTDSVPDGGLPVHWAQAEGYAHMLCAARGLPGVCVALCYLSGEGERRARMTRDLTAEELRRRFIALADGYIDRILRHLSRIAGRDASLRDLAFPYEGGFRPGQRAMSALVFRTLRDGGRAFIEAPTGTGKTAAVLYPAVKALPDAPFERIMYATARTTGRAAAAAMLERMSAYGARLRSVELIAQEKICPHPPCNALECPLLIGHFDRLDAALDDQDDAGHYDGDALRALADKHGLCRFEFELELALQSDIVVGDINYAFDPTVRLKRFFDAPHVLLVDEAHALVDRARSMYSASLTPMKRLRVAVGRAAGRKAAWKALGVVNKALEGLRGEGPAEGYRLTVPEALEEDVNAALEAIHDVAVPVEGLDDAEYMLWWFSWVLAQRDDDYALLYTRDQGGTLTMFLTNPASRLKATTALAHGAVFFSATLSPMRWMTDLLGGAPEDAQAVLPSPFPPENLLVMRAAVSTRYVDRQETQGRVARLAAAACRRPGRYLVFFPSYAYLRAVAPSLQELLPEAEFLIQSPSMTEEERAAFLAAYTDVPATVPLIGLAVLGGAFGEGVDLPGDRLHGAVIVGVALPQICLERETLRAELDALGSGYAYAYAYPGMIRVKQAVGRIIRTPEDRGVALLIDDRFGRPPHDTDPWRMINVRDEDEVERRVRGFWGEG